MAHWTDQTGNSIQHRMCHAKPVAWPDNAPGPVQKELSIARRNNHWLHDDAGSEGMTDLVHKTYGSLPPFAFTHVTVDQMCQAESSINLISPVSLCLRMQQPCVP